MLGAGLGGKSMKAEIGQWSVPSRPRRHRDIADEPKLRWTEILPELPL
jgi:hypothetical protein